MIKVYEKLKDGSSCLIREACPEDAEEMLEYVDQVAGETDNLTFGQGEFKMTLEEEQDFIEKQLNSDRELMLIARKSDEIVGQINMNGNLKERLAHKAEFGVTVRKEYWGLGIGRILVEMMLEYAREQGIKKINLAVLADNQRAISLYEKLGFKKEGREKMGMKIKGQYQNLIHMGLKNNNSRSD